MRHTAFGDAYAHNVQEVIQLLIQEAGLEPHETHHVGIEDDKDIRLAGGMGFQASIVEDSTGEYVLFVEGYKEEEVLSILQEAGVKRRLEDWRIGMLED